LRPQPVPWEYPRIIEGDLAESSADLHPSERSDNVGSARQVASDGVGVEVSSDRDLLLAVPVETGGWIGGIIEKCCKCAFKSASQSAFQEINLLRSVITCFSCQLQCTHVSFDVLTPPWDCVLLAGSRKQEMNSGSVCHKPVRRSAHSQANSREGSRVTILPEEEAVSRDITLLCDVLEVVRVMGGISLVEECDYKAGDYCR